MPKSICKQPGCDRPHKARGWCQLHYRRWRMHGDPSRGRAPLQERFWKFVDKRSDDECWPWLGYKDVAGYGRIGFKHVPQLASRVSYELHFGTIPQGNVVCHACDNPECVNPSHLWLGSQKDNLRDMYRKGRNNHARKLTTTQAREARRLRERGWSYQRIGNRYGVTREAIRAICVGRNWKHLR